MNVALRKTLDLYANVRPVKTLPGVKSRYDNVDLVVVRRDEKVTVDVPVTTEGEAELTDLIASSCGQ